MIIPFLMFLNTSKTVMNKNLIGFELNFRQYFGQEERVGRKWYAPV
jgi:hypothetical protein